MKQTNLLIMLIITVSLIGCSNNNSKNDAQNLSNESNNYSQKQSIPTPIHEERLSYEEYVEKYQAPSNSSQTNDTELSTEDIHDDNLLATYSTPLKNSSDERVNNIEIVCERLNNFILNPKETFSYNNTVGPYGPSDGFEEAPILLSDGTKKDGYGGGVCQLSSTLYNVVKNIKNVDITERHHHSAPVSYVPEGEDATVSLQSNLDFKFVNNTNYSIQFKASCDDNNVTVWAYKVL